MVGAAAILLMLVFSSAASASYVTKIMWGNPSVDVWAFTPATAGTFSYSVTWTDPFTGLKPDWPVATGQIVTMIDNNGTISQPFGNDLYDGVQQGTTVSPLQAKSISVTAGAVGNIYYFIAEAYDQDVKYDFTLNWAPKTGSPLLDVCGAGAHNKLLTGVAAEDNFPATADPTGTTNPWLQVMGPWPPAPAPFADNFLANYDAYVYETDYKPAGATFIESYTVGGYYSGSSPANQAADVYNVAAAPYDGHTYGGGKYFAPTPGENLQLAPSLWFPAVILAGTGFNNPIGTTGSTWLQPGEAPVPTNTARLTSYGRTRSPIWNTWSYPTTNPGDIATNSVPGYLWAPVDDASASKESYATENSSTASVSNRFYSDGTNPGVIWVHSTGPAGGKYNIWIDGVKTLSYQDNYSASMTYKVQTPINGLAAGYHTIMVESARAKNASSTGYNLYHDAFYGWDSPKWTNPGNVAPTTFIWTCEKGFDSTYYDMQNNSDGFTTYKWGQVTDTITAGGPHKLAASAQTNAAAALTFTGTTIQIQYLTGPHAGIFDVYVDAIRVSPLAGLDGYKAAPAAYTTWTSATLSPRTNNVHTVLVVVRGTKNAASDGYMVYLDWFQPGGTTPSSKVEAELP